MKPCVHCGLGDLSLYQVACRWPRDGVPPCELEEAERERAEQRTAVTVILVLFALFVIAAVAAVFLYPNPR